MACFHVDGMISLVEHKLLMEKTAGLKYRSMIDPDNVDASYD